MLRLTPTADATVDSLRHVASRRGSDFGVWHLLYSLDLSGPSGYAGSEVNDVRNAARLVINVRKLADEAYRGLAASAVVRAEEEPAPDTEDVQRVFTRASREAASNGRTRITLLDIFMAMLRTDTAASEAIRNSSSLSCVDMYKSLAKHLHRKCGNEVVLEVEGTVYHQCNYCGSRIEKKGFCSAKCGAKAVREATFSWYD